MNSMRGGWEGANAGGGGEGKDIISRVLYDQI